MFRDDSLHSLSSSFQCVCHVGQPIALVSYNLLFRVFLPLWLVHLVVDQVMCEDKISSLFLVLRYSSLHSTHYSYFYSYSLHSWSLPKKGIFVDPPFCPLNRCDTRCLPILLFWLVVIFWLSFEINLGSLGPLRLPFKFFLHDLHVLDFIYLFIYFIYLIIYFLLFI